MRAVLLPRRGRGRSLGRWIDARVALAASVALVAWGCGSCASSESSDTQAVAPEPSSSSSGVPPLKLVVIGDSIPDAAFECPDCVGFADQYAHALGKASGRDVDTINLSEHTGLTLPMLLRELPSLKQF